MPQPKPDLTGRSALVTGGGRGLGRVMAEGLADCGADLFITGGRQQAELDDTVAMLRAKGVRAEGMMADVSDAAQCEAAARAAEAAFGKVDILINNAARGPLEQGGDFHQRPAKFWETAPDVYERMALTNFVGPFLMARTVVEGMIARGWGRIVNISTSRITMLLGGGGPYGPIKAGLEVSSRIWAKQLEGTGVTVNVLLPGGAADTALIPGTPGGRAIPDFVSGKKERGSEGRHGGLLPAEVMAPPLLWLMAADGVTGRRLVACDWDADLDPDAAGARAMTDPVGDPMPM